MKQQLFGPKRVFVEDIALLIRADVHAIDDHLAVLDPDKRLFDTAFAHAQGLYLRPVQLDPGLETLLKKIVMPGFFIIRDQFFLRLRHLTLPLPFQKLPASSRLRTP